MAKGNIALMRDPYIQGCNAEARSGGHHMHMQGALRHEGRKQSTNSGPTGNIFSNQKSYGDLQMMSCLPYGSFLNGDQRANQRANCSSCIKSSKKDAPKQGSFLDGFGRPMQSSLARCGLSPLRPRGSVAKWGGGPPFCGSLLLWIRRSIKMANWPLKDLTMSEIELGKVQKTKITRIKRFIATVNLPHWKHPSSK